MLVKKLAAEAQEKKQILAICIAGRFDSTGSGNAKAKEG
jgi:hypothetical protein